MPPIEKIKERVLDIFDKTEDTFSDFLEILSKTKPKIGFSVFLWLILIINNQFYQEALVNVSLCFLSSYLAFLFLTHEAHHSLQIPKSIQNIEHLQFSQQIVLYFKQSSSALGKESHIAASKCPKTPK